MLDTMQDGASAPQGGNTGLVEGTLVLTLRGTLPVEALKPGDRIITRAGALRLAYVDMRLEARARLVRVSAAALGAERPDADITVAADQPILVRDWRARALADADRAMIPAGRLVDGEYIRTHAMRDARLYVLHFDVAAVIYAQGLELACEPAMAPA
ncbi:MAG: Hint domain-containing protein [Gemmobacter sp.]